MTAPKTANATATRVRSGDETAARRLRAHGWLVVPPEEQAEWIIVNPIDAPHYQLERVDPNVPLPDIENL